MSIFSMVVALPRHGLLDALATHADAILYTLVHGGSEILTNFMTSVF